ncbi:hypothetical protein ACLBSN_32235, partial [Klebsiella pneumoniae]
PFRIPLILISLLSKLSVSLSLTRIWSALVLAAASSFWLALTWMDAFAPSAILSIIFRTNLPIKLLNDSSEVTSAE